MDVVHRYSLVTLSWAFLAMFMLSTPVLAEPMHSKSEKPHHGMKKEGHGDKGTKKHSHQFTAHWAKTLSDDQKKQVDLMHLNLNRDRFVLRAELEMNQAKLNNLAAQDKADKAAITKQIDEVLATRRQMMVKRYEHLAEMRSILNEDQRLSYDMGILGRAGVRDGKVE